MADWRAYAAEQARAAGIDPRYFVAQIGAESGFNPSARSPAGALGIAQIMPATARGWGVDPMDPAAALRASAQNMARYLRSYGGSWEDALEAYNAGPGAVIRGRGVKYNETKAYVAKILGGGGAVQQPVPTYSASPAAPGPVASPLDPDTIRRLGAWKRESDQGVAEGRVVELPPDIVKRLQAMQPVIGAAAAPGPVVDSRAGRGHDETSPGAAFTPGGAGGNWGGSAPIAESLGALTGLPITSRKRDRQLTASGNPSDHWVGMPNSYAVDLGTSGAAGDAALAKLMSRLGRTDYKGGYWLNIPYGNGYRLQIGWRVPGHYDHIHLGARRA